MRLYFDENCVLHIEADDSTEAMALKYWGNEYDEHGDKMLEVHHQIPIRLGADPQPHHKPK